jgi:hypothetical protein
MMEKKLTVSGQMIDVRSDHLLAIVTYALEQADTSGIEVLNFGDNENKLEYDDQLLYLHGLYHSLRKLVATGNQDLLIVKTDDEQLTEYHKA